MEIIPRVRTLHPNVERAVLNWAYSEGFMWCFEYLEGKPESLLADLGLGVMLHNLMPSGPFKHWKNEVWSRASAVAKVLKGNEKLYKELYSTKKFWQELVEKVKTVAIEVSSAQGETEIAQAFSSGQYTAEQIERVLEPLCQALSLELYIFSVHKNKHRRVRSYNSCNNRIRCYVIVAEDYGNFHYLLHQNFKDSAPVDMESEFPFKTSRRDKLWTTEPRDFEEEFITSLLQLIRAPGLNLSVAPGEHAECMAACQRYASYRYSQSLPPIDLQIPDSCAMKACGPHELQNCQHYDMSERYVQLHCQHLFHHKCLLAHLTHTFYSGRDSGDPVRLLCPLCHSALVALDLDCVSASFRRDVEEYSIFCNLQKYKLCQACNTIRDSRLMVSHCDRHDVCAGCLRPLSCPLCTRSLTPADQEFVKRCFE